MEVLERMLAERACERLVYDYCRFVDFGEASRIADLFVEDGWWESDEIRMSGRDGIRRGFAARQGVTRRTSRHVCTNVIVDVLDLDHAVGISYLINYRYDSPTDQPELPVPAGHPKFVGEYRDTFVRTPDGWRFATRRCDLAFLRRSSNP